MYLTYLLLFPVSLVSFLTAAPLSTGKPATSSGCTRLIQSLQLRSDGQQGWCGCTSIPTLAWSRSLFNEDPMCEEQQTKVIETLQKLRIHLYPFETTITIGGHYIIPNLLWNNTSEYNRCDLNSLSQCQATKHSGLKDDDDGDDSQVCLFNEDEIANYTQNQLKTDRFTKVLPYESENISQLPFPDAFNVTINSVKPSTLCATSNSAISCHLAIDNDCSFYFCHTINITQVIEVTFEYNRPEKDTAISIQSTVTMMCHNKSIETLHHHDGFLFNLLKQNGGYGTVCHFITRQASFFMCETMKDRSF